MGVAVTVTIQGVDELMNKFMILEDEATSAAIEAVQANVDAIVADAQSLCPVRTGTLRDSIQGDVVVDGWNVMGTVGTDVYYGEYVEFGTYKMAAEPYLTPAFEANAPQLGPDLGDLLMGLV